MFHVHQNRLLAVVVLVGVFAGNPEAASDQEIDEAQAAATVPLPKLFPERLREETLEYTGMAVGWGREEPIDTTWTFAKDTLERESAVETVWRIAYRERGVPRNATFVLRSEDLAALEYHIRLWAPGSPGMELEETLVFRKEGKEIGGRDETEEDVLLLPAPVFASLDVAVLAMPLAEGFETLVRSFELIEQMTVQWKVTVAGAETVSTPAGTFDTYKVTLTCLHSAARSGSIWVTKAAPYRIVRRESPYTFEKPMGRATLELARIRDAASLSQEDSGATASD